MLALLVTKTTRPNIREWFYRVDRFIHPTAYARVARGAEVLDRRGPALWWTRVTKPIRLMSVDQCIVSQVYQQEADERGSNRYGYGACRLGLEWPCADYGFFGTSYGPMWRAWKREIALRSGG